MNEFRYNLETHRVSVNCSKPITRDEAEFYCSSVP